MSSERYLSVHALPTILTAENDQIVSERLLLMNAPFDTLNGQRVFSILVQCLCQARVNELKSDQIDSDRYDPWTEAFIMRPSVAGTTDFQIVEETRTRAFLITESPSQDMKILSYRWGVNDVLVSSFQPGDLLGLEAKVPSHGNGLLVGWAVGEICISFVESPEIPDICKHKWLEVSDIAPNRTGLTGPKKSALLAAMATALFEKFEKFRDPLDLDSAVSRQLLCIIHAPSDSVSDSQMATHWSTLGLLREYRFKLTGDTHDMKEALAHHLQALRLTAETDSFYAARLCQLGYWSQTCFETEGSQEHLQNAIKYHQQSISKSESNSPALPRFLTNLGNSYHSRYKLLGNEEDLKLAIATKQKAIDAASSGHPDLAMAKSNLGASLMAEFKETGNAEFLDKAIELFQEAVHDTSDDNTSKFGRVSNLAVAVWTRFLRGEEIADLNEAVALYEKCGTLTPNDYHMKLTWFANYGGALITKYNRDGKVGSLDKGVLKLKQAVEMTPDSHPLKASYLHNLQVGSSMLYVHLRNEVDITTAIHSAKEAVRLTSKTSVEYPQYLAGLSIAYHKRFANHKDEEDLIQAQVAMDEVLNLVPLNHGDRNVYLIASASQFLDRFKGGNDKVYLSNAVNALSEAYKREAASGIQNLHTITSYVNALSEDYVHNKNASSYMIALTVAKQTLSTVTYEHPLKAKLCFQLGTILLHDPPLPNMSAQSFNHAAMLAFMTASKAKIADINVQFSGAAAWAHIAMGLNDVSNTLEGFTRLIELLPTLAWPGHSITRRQELLRVNFKSIYSGAWYAITCNELQKTVEFLENGRSILWASVLKLRVDLQALHDHDDVLAEKLESLKRIISKHVLSFEIPIDLKDLEQAKEITPEQYRQYASDWDAVVNQVRAIEGFSQFLMPATFQSLKPLPKYPVVMVNISAHGCAALILVREEIIHVPLPELSENKIEHWHNALVTGLQMMSQHGDEEAETMFDKITLKPILRGLWKTLAQPVLERLEFTHNFVNSEDLPRICWCPTGLLTLLPIHASGPHRHGKPNIYDYVISSYTTNVSSLVRSLQREVTMEPVLTAISQHEAPKFAPEFGDLPHAEEDVKAIQDHIKSKKLTTKLEHISGEQATKDTIIGKLEQVQWVHFSCHGEQKLDNPLDSYFALHDAPLTLRDLSERPLKNADFAYLSACKTATGATGLPDEAMHLAAGLQIAGFRSQIASMWSVGDAEAQMLVKEVYDVLLGSGPDTRLDSTRAALALHKGVKMLRAKKVPAVRWVPFIHMGI